MRCSTAARRPASSTYAATPARSTSTVSPTASPRAPAASSVSTRSACPPTGRPSSRSPSEHGLFLLEDAACAVGGTFEQRPCGAFGDVAVFSLHARKGITSGEGGVVVTDDAEIADRVRSMSCFGQRSAYRPAGRGPARDPGVRGGGLQLQALRRAGRHRPRPGRQARRVPGAASCSRRPLRRPARRRARRRSTALPRRPGADLADLRGHRRRRRRPRRHRPRAACTRDRFTDRHLRAAPRAGLRRTRRLPDLRPACSGGTSPCRCTPTSPTPTRTAWSTPCARCITRQRADLCRSPGPPDPTSRAGTPDGAHAVGHVAR